MNLGGTEKALLSLLYTLRKEQLKITLLLCEKGGVLESHIPDFVKVEYLQDFNKMKPVLETPPHHTFVKHLKNCKIFSAVGVAITYCKIKITGNWYHNYQKVLQQTPDIGTYDIAIAFAGPADFISYLVVKKVSARKKIQWIHFDIEKVLRDYKFGKKFYPYFDQIFCVSQSSKDIFLKNFPQFKNKTDVFNNIVSAPKIKKSAEEGSSFLDDYKGIRILTVGRFTKEKGQHLIPEVVVRLKADDFDFRWYLVGDGIEKGVVQTEVTALNITNHVFFLGEKENPYPFMKDCDVYVQPSLHEGYGITVAEAQVFNKPIVVTNFASAKDLIENNITGLITEISSDGIYLAVKSLLLNPDLQCELSIKTVKPVKVEEYNISKLLH